MLAALEHQGPVIFLEHKLLVDAWLDYLGAGGRKTVQYDVPAAGAKGPVPDRWAPLLLGQAVTRREGGDITLVSLGVGVHRCLEAADVLARDGIAAGVIDLRTAAPLDRASIRAAAVRAGRVLVVDEDYRDCGLSGEVAATIMEAGIAAKFGRVCTEETIPYARAQEDEALPNVKRIVTAALTLFS